MLRVVILLAVVVAAIALVRGMRSGLAGRRPPALGRRTVRCAHCDVYLPREEAVERGGRSYCSSEHAEAARE